MPRHGSGHERAFTGPVRGCRAAMATAGQRRRRSSATALPARLHLLWRGMKMPRTTSAGKPDANFLLEIKHGLNDAQQKFHAEWRGQSTIRPPINGKARA